MFNPSIHMPPQLHEADLARPFNLQTEPSFVVKPFTLREFSEKETTHRGKVFARFGFAILVWILSTLKPSSCARKMVNISVSRSLTLCLAVYFFLDGKNPRKRKEKF
jgi:hypothetical protein